MPVHPNRFTRSGRAKLARRYLRRSRSRRFYEFVHVQLRELEYLAFGLFALAAIVTILWWALHLEHRILYSIPAIMQMAAASAVPQAAVESEPATGSQHDHR